MKRPFDSSVSRRCFLRAALVGATVGGAAAIWPSASRAALLACGPTVFMLEHASHAQFAELVGTEFRLELGGQIIALRLLEATNLAPRSGPQPVGLREPFSLIFRAPADARLTQRIYPLHHDNLGGLELFLVPIGLGADGLRCEAVFN